MEAEEPRLMAIWAGTTDRQRLKLRKVRARSHTGVVAAAPVLLGRRFVRSWAIVGKCLVRALLRRRQP